MSISEVRRGERGPGNTGWRCGWRAYAIAVGAVAVATALRWALDPLYGTTVQFITYFPAIILVALLAGARAGLAATALSTLVADYVFMEPRWGFIAVRASDWVSLALFATSGGLISWMAELLGRAQRRQGEAEERSRGAEALQKQARLIDLAPAATMVRAMDGTISFWSDGAERLYGWTRQEAIGRVSHDLLRTEFPEPLEQIVAELRRGGKWSGELRHYGKDGRRVIAESHWLAQFTPEGQVKELLESNIDITQRKQAEEGLRKSEQFNRGLVEASIDCIKTLDLEGNLLSMSGGGQRLLEICDLSRYLNGSWVGLWNEADRPRVGQAVAEARAGGTGRFQAFCPSEKGNPRWWDVIVSPILDAQGRPERLLAVSREVSERKRAEEGLRASEERFRQLAENIPQLAWMTDADGWIFWYNKRWFDYTGTTLEQMQGWGWQAVHHPEHVERVTERFKAALARGEPWEDTFPLRGRDGGYRWFLSRAFPIRDAEGKVVRWFGSNTDITELREAEVAVREKEEQFRTLADSIPTLAWWANGDGYITWYNRRWYEYTGTTPEQMEGWGWQSVHDPEMLPKVLQRWKGSIATGEPFEMVFPLRGADGVFRPFLTRVTPLKDERGRVLQWFGTNTDISEQKRAEEELELRVEQRTAELSAANKELEAFGYSVSHDLRAPLRHIDSYIHQLERNVGASLDEKSQKHLRIVVEAARRMGNLIDDLLVLSRLGRATMEERGVNLGRLVDEVREELAPAMAGRAIEWRVGPLPEVQGDPNLLRSAMTNLLSNAIKYTRGRDPAVIEVGSREQDGEVVCFVRDNGAGFEMRFVDKLFGVFQRLHRAKDFEGTGIGLASVRRVIQRHGGQTWAEGELGKGATFYFSLPGERVVQVRNAASEMPNAA